LVEPPLYTVGMSLTANTWLHIGHIVGFVTWIAGMIATLTLLRVHAMVEGAARDVLARQERKTAMLMDLGATLAMACGFAMAFGNTPNAFKTGGWLHIKLTVVALVLLGTHGLARAHVKRFGLGQIKPLPRALPYVVMVAVVVVIILGAHPTLLRK
jgi:protoporphyrinogen IX oxidase